MIDYIKIIVPFSFEYEKRLIESGKFNFKQSFDYTSGKESNYPKKAKFKNFDLEIFCTTVVISGSIHKLKNLIENSKGHNYDDFCFDELTDMIANIEDVFFLNTVTYRITNLEFGFNIEVSKASEDILKYNLIMFDFKEHTRLNEFNGLGYLKEFSKSDYSMKIYDKSKQYGLSNVNLLRIEVRYRRSRILRRLGIYKLSDLKNIDVLRAVYVNFIHMFNYLMIVDSVGHYDLSLKVETLFAKWTSAHTWNRYREENFSDKKIINRKKKFENLLHTENLLTLKTEIKEQLDIKFRELTQSRYMINIA